MNPIADIAKGTTEAIFGKGVELIDNLTMSKDEKAAKKIEWQQMIDDHVEDLKAAEILMEQTVNEERKAAREFALGQMQSKDWLVRNFRELFSSVVIVSTIAFGIALFLVEIPEKNERMIEMLFDMFLIGSIATIREFYLGSSKSSKDKTEIMAQQERAKSFDKFVESRREKKQRLKKQEEEQP